MGYLAFGEATQDIITFNLPNNWMAAVVKLALCIGLFFTFPAMMIPVYEIVERNLAAKVGAALIRCLKGIGSRSCLTPTLHDITRYPGS